jgi:hypothetical protein
MTSAGWGTCFDGEKKYAQEISCRCPFKMYDETSSKFAFRISVLIVVYSHDNIYLHKCSQGPYSDHCSLALSPLWGGNKGIREGSGR